MFNAHFSEKNRITSDSIEDGTDKQFLHISLNYRAVRQCEAIRRRDIRHFQTLMDKLHPSIISRHALTYRTNPRDRLALCNRVGKCRRMELRPELLPPALDE